MNEFSFIKQYLARLSESEPGAFRLTNDAATLTPSPGHSLVLTKDILIENVHFLPHTPPEKIAQKLLRVNLSDLAAMGAKPRAYMLGLGLSKHTLSEDWLKAFVHGLKEDQERFGITLIGGDTTAHAGALFLSLTALGEVPEGEALPRQGSVEGDDIYLSGTLGDAALGLLALRGEIAKNPHLITRYELPEPRIALGLSLRGKARAAMDVSDGLLQDIGHMLAPGQGACFERSRLPLSPAAESALREAPSLIGTILTGGDDYELLFTAPVSARESIECLPGVTRIGKITGNGEVRCLEEDGSILEVEIKGFQHF
jgi:thiamine-monophosphate kinase